VHERRAPFTHRFNYRIASLMIDLERLGEAETMSRLFSVESFNLYSFFERDHGARDGSPLIEWARTRFEEAGIAIGAARVRLLCAPRVLGYVFNPLSIYFAEDRQTDSLKGVIVTDTQGQSHSFDEVILACHSDQALKLLEDASTDERDMLGAIPYSQNEAVLHRDESLVPKRENARAAWTYLREAGWDGAAVSYDMNRLQGIPSDKPLFVTLNPVRQPDPALTFGRFEYDHPQFTAPGMAAQRIFNRIQGVQQTWFAGAWLGYGFHEDGLRAGLRAALRLGGEIPWAFADGDITGGPWGERGDAQGDQAAVSAAE
jgi:hypothetical protein